MATCVSTSPSTYPLDDSEINAAAQASTKMISKAFDKVILEDRILPMILPGSRLSCSWIPSAALRLDRMTASSGISRLKMKKRT